MNKDTSLAKHQMYLCLHLSDLFEHWHNVGYCARA